MVTARREAAMTTRAPDVASAPASVTESGTAPDTRPDLTPTGGGEMARQRASVGNRYRPRLPRNASVPRFRTGEDRLGFARGLTDRDVEIVLLVARLGVLTTDQVAEAFFSGRKRAWERLTTLHQQAFLDRFRPFAPTGSAPHHYVLGKHGAVLAAVHDPDHPDHADPHRAGRRHRPGDTIAMQTRTRLAHTLGVNGVCTALLRHARHNRDSSLIRWRTETEIARHYPRRYDQPVRPDAFFVWRQWGDDLTAFLEYDRGTERPSSRLAAKLDGYTAMETARGATSWVLFAFTSYRREQNVRHDLADHADRLPIATATLDPAEVNPADSIWRRLAATRYHDLADLAVAPKPQASLDRAGEGRGWNDWLTRGLHEDDPW